MKSLKIEKWVSDGSGSKYENPMVSTVKVEQLFDLVALEKECNNEEFSLRLEENELIDGCMIMADTLLAVESFVLESP